MSGITKQKTLFFLELPNAQAPILYFPNQQLHQIKTFILHQSIKPPLYKVDLKVKDVSEPSPTFTTNGNLRIIGVKVIDVGGPSDE